MNILISAGEASGDLYGAALATELLSLNPNLVIGGIGGSQMKGLELKLLGDSSTWGSISILQSVREAPRAVGAYYRFKEAFRSLTPGVFVAIDFGFMNLRLCRLAKEAGWKVVYFVPPGSWRRDRQGKDLPGLTDQIITNFPWSAEILTKMGANVHFFGHPLKQIYQAELATEHQRSGIAVLPGSRRSELEQLLPVLQAGLKERSEVASLPVPASYVDWVTQRWQRPGDHIINGSVTHGVMKTLRGSEWGLIKSGTATLEATLAETPMIVVYKVSSVVAMEAKLVGFKRPQFYSQPNILLNRAVVPELIQETLTLENLEREIERIQTPAAQIAQREGFAEINALLGPSDAITKSAELIMSLL